jgi:predicted metal-binding transcription factor (methanogenesis marker protein 9)
VTTISNDEIGVRITGDSSGASEAMKKAATAVSDGTEKMKGALSGMEGAFAKVQGMLIGLVGLVAGGKFLQKGIDETNKLTEESIKLSRALGISMEEATSLNTALGDIYTDSDSYIGTFQRFSQQLRRNEDGMKEMGIKTRDANGHLRDSQEVFRDALSMVGQFKPGLDQTTFAQKAFGKSIEEVMQLQRLNNEVLEEAKRKNEELGLVITDQNVEANHAYKAAMNDVGDVMTAVMKVVGEAVMPVFTQLAKYFASTGPTVINIFRGAMTGLLAVFRTVEMAVKTVGGAIFEMINHMIDQLGNLSDLLAAVFRGDFQEAANIYDRMGQRFVQGVKNVATNTKEAFIEAKEAFSGDLERVWGDKVAAKGTGVAGSSGTKRMGNLKDDPKEKKDKSRTSEWEAELEARKVAYQKENDLRELSKQAELKYWSDIQARVDLSVEERLAVRKKVASAELEIMKEQRTQINALSEQAITAYQQQQLEELDARREAAAFEVEMGRMTNMELLALDQQLEDERYRITKEAIAARLELLSKDPTKNVVALQRLNDELAAVEREHQRNSQTIMREQHKEQTKDWQSFFQNIGQSWAGIVQGLVNRTMTLGQAVRSLFGTLLSQVTGFITQMLAKKAAAWTTEKALGLAGIGMEAAKAGAGAAASQAPIPIIGPALALAAMATVFGAVSALSGRVPSARGGYSVPSGVNPLTQLHEEEMVLPKEESQVVKDLARGGGGGAPVILKGATAGEFFIAHKREMVTFLKSLNRNFDFS